MGAPLLALHAANVEVQLRGVHARRLVVRHPRPCTHVPTAAASRAAALKGV